MCPNADLVNLRSVPPKVCVLFDGDVRKKSEGTRILRDAKEFAESKGGKNFEIERDTLEDYLLDSTALSKAIGATPEAVEVAIERVRKKGAKNPSNTLKSKAILNEVFSSLRGSWFNPEQDSALIASHIPVEKLPDDLKAVITTLKNLMNLQHT